VVDEPVSSAQAAIPSPLLPEKVESLMVSVPPPLVPPSNPSAPLADPMRPEAMIELSVSLEVSSKPLEDSLSDEVTFVRVAVEPPATLRSTPASRVRGEDAVRDRQARPVVENQVCTVVEIVVGSGDINRPD